MSDKACRDPLKKPSGSEFRKRANEGDEREGSLLEKIPKLESFFGSFFGNDKGLSDNNDTTVAVPSTSSATGSCIISSSLSFYHHRPTQR
jgi:hypothetical protein